MARISQFEDIRAWQAARELTREIYELTASPRFRNEIVLRDQLRRAAVSAKPKK